MKILITGSRGFLGGTIGRFAARSGHEVIGVGRASQPEIGWPGEYFAADVLGADISPLVREFDPVAIVHAAGTASVGGSFSSPLDDLRATLLSWSNVLESVRRSGKSPLLIYPSSAAVYGQPVHLPIPETAPLNPISPYGFHKAACELIAREYALCFGLRVMVLRLFSVFGEFQRRLLLWELFQQFSDEKETVWLEGTGKETRDYLYADDLSDAVLQLIQKKLSIDSGSYLVFNLASGNEVNVLNLAKQVRSILGSRKPIGCHGKSRTGDPARWQADISAIKRSIEWKPGPLATGLAQCLSAWKSD